MTTGTPARHSVAALLHGFKWAIRASQFELVEGARICRLRGTAISKWYTYLCEVHGVDDREPFAYDTYLLLEPTPAEPYLLDMGDPFSRFDRMANLLAVVTGSPIQMCRVLHGNDGFNTLPQTTLVYAQFGQTEFLVDKWPDLNRRTLGQLKKACSISTDLWTTDKSNGRIANALMFFHSSWRSHLIEHICLNLAIVLEVLFAPHSLGETSHQIAFNVSHFVGTTAVSRAETYALIKKFYGLRSSVIHGGTPSDTKLIDTTVKVFYLIAGILQKILVSEALARTFNNDESRKQLLQKYLFH